MGLGTGLSAIAILAFASSLLAGFLLKQTSVGELSWRNYVAGFLLPWAFFLRPGSLRGLVLKNSVAAIVVGAAAAGYDWLEVSKPGNVGASETHTTSAMVGTTILALMTMAGWIILLAGWIVLCKNLVTNRSEPISALVLRRDKFMPLVLPPAAVGLSIVFRYWHWYWLSFLTVWGPLVAVFLPVILLVLAVFIQTLRGKPIRWN
jgi:hypothetical protein